MTQDIEFLFGSKDRFFGVSQNSENNKTLDIMYRYRTYYGQEKNEAEYALRGAILYCTHGNKYVRLDMPEDYGIYSGGHPVMSCKDNKFGENISSFGACGNSKYEPVYSDEVPPPSETEQDNSGKDRYKCETLESGDWLISVESLFLGIVEGSLQQALSLDSNSICLKGGRIGIKQNPEPINEEKELLITMEQMNKFEFPISEEDLEELNNLLEDYDITDKGSIALFMATCGHESGKGTTLLEDNTEQFFAEHGYSSETRGAGYLQITGDDQEKFYKEVLRKEPPKDRARDIAQNYAWLASVWEWAGCSKGGGVIMNNYVKKNGSGENIFLVTQYFINSYLSKEHYPYFDSDLADIRKGAAYSYNLEEKWIDYKGDEYKGVLHINNRTYRLPLNYYDRKANYDDAIKVFMQEEVDETTD